MIDQLREMFAYRNLIKQLVIRDLKVRYKNSALGFLWSLANPIVLVFTITIVVKYLMQVGIKDYSAYLLAAFLPWTFFQMALLDSSQVILSHRDLLKKVYFPREVLPVSVVIANLVHFLLAMVVFFAYVIFYLYLMRNGAGILITTIYLPVLILMQSLLILGISFFVSCMNVFYEDTKYLLSALLNVLFYVTPVMYPAELVYQSIVNHNLPPVLYNIYMLNPVNAIIDAYRKILLPAADITLRGTDIQSKPIDLPTLGIAFVVCVLFAAAGYGFFNSRKWLFAERA